MWAKLFSKTKEILICTKKGNISLVAAFQSQPRNFFIFYFHRPFKVNLIGGSLLLQWLYTSFLDDSRFFISLINKFCEAEYCDKQKEISEAQTWFALARVRPIFTSPSLRVAIWTGSDIFCTFSFRSPARHTFTLVWTLGTVSILARDATPTDSLTVIT